jgi:putative membrane protein
MLFLWIKAFHIIAMIAWFAGLFYLPRLFVYHADTMDEISLNRFRIMEWRLFYAIMTPAAIITLFLGSVLLSFNLSYYLKQPWMHLKLTAVFCLIIYHVMCYRHMRQFQLPHNSPSSYYFRIFNEIPTLLLIIIVIMVTVKPSF